MSPMLRPCEQLAIADKWDCPNYGSSDCSISPTWGDLQYDIERAR